MHVTMSTNPQATTEFLRNFPQTSQSTTPNSFEDILNMLFQQHQPRGPPPTSKKYLETCPVITISTDSSEICTICQDVFSKGDQSISLPCKHMYHKDCIFPWLQTRNTCPTCRFPLPIDEEEKSSTTQNPVASNNVVPPVSGIQNTTGNTAVVSSEQQTGNAREENNTTVTEQRGDTNTTPVHNIEKEGNL